MAVGRLRQTGIAGSQPAGNLRGASKSHRIGTAITLGKMVMRNRLQDQGNGKAGTLVYPVKATYTVNTFYRTATEVEEGWIRILNFYVNAFGEWAIGSEENVKSPKVQRIQK